METESGCFFLTKDILPSNSWCCRAPGRDGCRNLAQVVLKDVGFVSWVDTWPRKKQIVGFFARASKESSEKSTDTLIQILFLKTVSTSMHRTCIHHRYIQICWFKLQALERCPPWLKKHSWGMLWVICCTLFWDISYQWRKGWWVSSGKMPNVRCQNRTWEFFGNRYIFFFVWKIMMNRIVGNSDWWSEFSTPQSRNCFPLLRSMLYDVTLLN